MVCIFTSVKDLALRSGAMEKYSGDLTCFGIRFCLEDLTSLELDLVKV